jgi:hypothetical protein
LKRACPNNDHPAREGLQEFQMPQKKNTALRADIRRCLTSGGLTTSELAAQLNQSSKIISTTCARMVRDGELTHRGPYKRYRWHLPDNAPPAVAVPRKTHRQTSPSRENGVMHRRNRSDPLGAEILAELDRCGPMTTPWLAQNLGECPRAIAASCVTLARDNKIRSYSTGHFYRSPSGKKTAERFWELGPSDNPPPKPVRKRNYPEAIRPTVGIDEADLEWMEKYRNQAAERRNRREIRV